MSHSVSVVVPTYNRAGTLARAIRSALAAIVPGDEVIVIDDGSTDDTTEVLKPFLPHIRYLSLRHGGAGVARNLGVAASRNSLVAFLDSDDEWFADKLMLQRALMHARPDVLYCFSDFGVRGGTGGDQRRYLRHWHKDVRSWSEILHESIAFSSLAPLPPERSDFQVYIGDLFLAEMLRPYIFTSTLVARREAAGDALHFAEDVVTYEDWECFGRLARAGSGAFLDCETAWQWDHAGPRLSTYSAFVQATAELRILPRVWGADQAFIARHGAQYHAMLQSRHLLRARYLIAHGRTREAREELMSVPDAPPSYRVLASMPGPLLRGAAKLKHSLLLPVINSIQHLLHLVE